MKKKTLKLTEPLVIILTFLIVLQFGSTLGNLFPAIPPINSIYIRADGSIEPFTPLIKVEGNIYTLTGDLTNTTLKIERDGIILDGSGYTITGNDIRHEGINLSNRTNCVVRNIVINDSGTGILMNNASRNILTENRINTWKAFYMINADDNIIVGNIATNKGYGVVGSGSNNKITDNDFSSSLTDSFHSTGISLDFSNNNTLSRNNISHGIGINLADSKYNNISNNTLIGEGTELGSVGIFSARSSHNLVFHNSIKEKSSVESAAIHFSDACFNNIFFENVFVKNTCGVALCYYSVEEARPENVYNNTFYRNSFIDNVNDVRVAKGTPTNYWDYDQQGNFWSNYTEQGPYIIDENNVDNYPLKQPVDINLYATPTEPPEDRNPPHLDPIVYLIPVSIIIAIILVSVLLYHMHRKTANLKL